MPLLWQTAVWKQHRLSASIIDCSDSRFAVLISGLENQLQHLYDYRALPFLILETFIDELLTRIGRAKTAEWTVDPPPTVAERFDHHVDLNHLCLAYIPFLGWLTEFDILCETAFACDQCLRSCLLHNAHIVQATLTYANAELSHLNQQLLFHLCFQTNNLLSSLQTSKESCCDHCSQVKHLAYIAFSLLPIAVILTLSAVFLRPRWTSKWIFWLSIAAFILHLVIRHYIRVTLRTFRHTFLSYFTDSRHAAGTVLAHLARLLTPTPI
ncbi:hypothetical protein AUEXF2481DRAFT_551655 [Aureobasidium subglaciale EXF-2481]|uniref:Uncharacterized protein n=1 Tax=Aureobasidium subglaciale (strain EXF-2481) TaxID=1043005 RepID=A0A074YJ69_AURSE|nr:uncharacterized protein AUEXF2481DRAFT_551655 [Aureobasidium subglaciale EXF-2481]KEQ97863.1 hypothetical protein AUEXF2481DRAFT_551655 [Aureobasidium subglaciale EXF-2481]